MYAVQGSTISSRLKSLEGIYLGIFTGEDDMQQTVLCRGLYRRAYSAGCILYIEYTIQKIRTGQRFAEGYYPKEHAMHCSIEKSMLWRR